jgi:hypothetical protein
MGDRHRQVLGAAGLSITGSCSKEQAVAAKSRQLQQD